MNESVDELKATAEKLAEGMANAVKSTAGAMAGFAAAAGLLLAETEGIADEAKSSRNSRRRKIRVGSTKCTAVNKDERERRNAKRKAALQAKKRNRK
jgi:hypothetical protein